MENLPDIPGLDTASGIERLGGYTESYLSVLKSFTISSKSKPSEMMAGLERGDIKNLGINFHALKSALASIGAAELSGKAANLESACERGDLPFINGHSPPFVDELADFNGELTSFFDTKISGDSKAEGSETLLREKITAVLEAVQNLENNEAVEILESLEEYTFSEELDNKIKRLSECLACFDQMGAEDICVELLG